MPVKVSASVLSVQENEMVDTINDLIKSGVDMIHFDVLDGIFVDNKSFDYRLIKQLSLQFTDCIFDVHLMTIDPINDIPNYADCGVDIISVHLDSKSNIADAIKLIKSYGIRPSIVINADVDVMDAVPYLNDVDMVLVMSVQAGYGGQEFMPSALEKIAFLRKNFPNLEIEVDGGIGFSNAGSVAKAGANIIVSGTKIINAPCRREMIEKIKNA